MKKFLFIAEKPSLMRDVRSCYNQHKKELVNCLGEIQFIALAGHVCAWCLPNEYDKWKDVKWHDIDYPINPNYWKIKPIDDARKKKILGSIKEQSKHVDGIIVGTDSDLEGYGIYYLLENYLKLDNMYALRFIEHSLTDAEILKSLKTMTDFHKDPVHTRFTQSFVLRSQSDWLYGMNATCIVTIRKNSLMKIGRVKAPTINLVYNNSMEIEKFQSKKYYLLGASYGAFNAVLIDSKNRTQVQFEKKTDVPQPSKEGVVLELETSRASSHAPKLFDLSAAQAEAGRVYKFSPARTLELIQSLYEKHKLLSYPRTQCRVVSVEKSKEFPEILKNMDAFPELKPYVEKISQQRVQTISSDKQVVNDAEVQKESHDALIPTLNRPDLSKLTEDEKKICLMIYQRVLAQFLPLLVEDKTVVITKHDDYLFSAKGKTVIEPGWSVLYKDSKDILLPELKKGDPIIAKQFSAIPKKTTPPKRLTQSTLVNAMRNIASQVQDKELRKSLAESQGIGTPATRAAIISDIIKTGYVNEKKDGLYITVAGKEYIEALHGFDIISPLFAAEMDTEIKKVQRGEVSFSDANQVIQKNLNEMCKEMLALPETQPQLAQTRANCPKCKTVLSSQKFSYTCPSCGWKLNKSICGKAVDERLLMLLVSGKTSPRFKLKKKDGTEFSACLTLSPPSYNIQFSSGVCCPNCGKEARMNNGGVFCECGFKLFRNCAHHTFSDSELRTLLTKKKLPVINDFQKKDGSKFSAAVELKAEGVQFVSDFEKK